MAKDYLPVDRDQVFLLPPDLRDWLPPGHVVWFVLDTVAALDLAAFHARRRLGGAGRAAYHPQLLLGLLIYAYAVGERSSRQIERLCATDVAFRVLCAQHVPDHATIARFRAEHADAVEDLFGQVLLLCAAAGMGRFAMVALDGTKIAANAAMAANKSAEWVRAQAARIVAEAGEVDAAEDQLYGDKRGDELPPEFADPGTRPAAIKAALAELDRQAKAQAEAEADKAARRERPPSRAERESAERVARARARVAERRAAQEAKIAADQARRAEAAAAGRVPWGGSRPRPVEESSQVQTAEAKLARLEETARRRAAEKARTAPVRPAPQPPRRVNLTDPDSRIMPTASGWVQGYNAQIVVSDDYLILATQLSQSPVDVGCYQPLVRAAEAAATAMAEHAGRAGRAEGQIGCVLADAGYASDANLSAAGPDRLIALGKRRDLEASAATGVIGDPGPHARPRERMRHRLATPEGLARYRRRGAIVEPVNAHLKDRRGLRRFSRRGLQAAAAEFTFAATVTNLLRLRAYQPA